MLIHTQPRPADALPGDESVTEPWSSHHIVGEMADNDEFDDNGDDDIDDDDFDDEFDDDFEEELDDEYEFEEELGGTETGNDREPEDEVS